MKRSVSAIFALTLFLASCQKNVEALPSPASTAAVQSIQDAEVAAVPAATFGTVLPYWLITAKEQSIVFSDSLHITRNKAFLQLLKFKVIAKKIYFSNYTLSINGHRVPVTGSYENGTLTLALNKKKGLPVGDYKIEAAAKVYGPQQVFRMDLLPGNAIITDDNGFLASINGLPLVYLIGTRKN